MFRNFPVKGLVWVTEGAGVEKMGPPSCMADGGGHPYPTVEPQDHHRAVSSSNSECLPLTASVSICCSLSLSTLPHAPSSCLCPFFLSLVRPFLSGLDSPVRLSCLSLSLFLSSPHTAALSVTPDPNLYFCLCFLMLILPSSQSDPSFNMKSQIISLLCSKPSVDSLNHLEEKKKNKFLQRAARSYTICNPVYLSNLISDYFPLTTSLPACSCNTSSV